MPIEDIGYLIFVELLRMSEYPGSPFTGSIVRDLIMFLLIPTIFIILVVYMLLGRLFTEHQRGLRMLVGVGIYLFIIAGGYYSAFALLAGPYFIFLIFILGLFYFIFGHFGVGRAGAGMPSGAAGGQALDSDKIRQFLGMRTINPVERKYLENQLKIVNQTLHVFRTTPGTKAELEISRLMSLRAELEIKLFGNIRNHPEDRDIIKHEKFQA